MGFEVRTTETRPQWWNPLQKPGFHRGGRGNPVSERSSERPVFQFITRTGTRDALQETGFNIPGFCVAPHAQDALDIA
jgi:hypothetical protein